MDPIIVGALITGGVGIAGKVIDKMTEKKDIPGAGYTPAQANMTNSSNGVVFGDVNNQEAPAKQAQVNQVENTQTTVPKDNNKDSQSAQQEAKTQNRDITGDLTKINQYLDTAGKALGIGQSLFGASKQMPNFQFNPQQYNGGR